MLSSAPRGRVASSFPTGSGSGSGARRGGAAGAGPGAGPGVAAGCGAGSLSVARGEVREPTAQRAELHVALAPGGLDVPQQGAHHVAEGHQGGADVRRRSEGPVAQAAQEMLTGMGGALQQPEAQEPAGALERVHRPEDVVDGLQILRSLLERQQVVVHTVEHLLGLQDELPDQLGHFFVGLVRGFGSGAHLSAIGRSRARNDRIVLDGHQVFF